jgi:hypothetical protein
MSMASEKGIHGNHRFMRNPALAPLSGRTGPFRPLVVRDKHGALGGIFTARKHALHFALYEQGSACAVVEITDRPLELAVLKWAAPATRKPRSSSRRSAAQSGIQLGRRKIPR